MTRSWRILLAATAVAVPLRAQKAPVIQDNSFLIEEAYNQEAGVVQHISFFSREKTTHFWGYSFTQEWPFRGQRHQLSYTVPLVGGGGNTTGVGDMVLNYRLQLVGKEGSRVWMAPRLSAVLPTGSWRAGRGNGVFGLDARIPVSVELSERAALHLNAGASLFPSAKTTSGATATLLDASAGASLILMPAHWFNLLVEGVVLSSEDVTGPGDTSRHSSVILNPGVRWAHNFKSGLQIVPGVAYAFGVNDTAPPDALILYLSFEHPFRRQ